MRGALGVLLGVVVGAMLLAPSAQPQVIPPVIPLVCVYFPYTDLCPVPPSPTPTASPTVTPAPTATATPLPTATPTATATQPPAVVTTPVPVPSPIASVVAPEPAPSATPAAPAKPKSRGRPGRRTGAGPLLASHTRGFVKKGRRLALTIACPETCVARLRVESKTRTGPTARFRLPAGRPVKVRLKVPRSLRGALRVTGSTTNPQGGTTEISRPVRATRRR